MKINQNTKPFFSIIMLLSFCSISPAFSNKTHKAISENAALNSQANVYLKNKLGFSQGLGTSLLLDQAVVPALERIPTDQFETRINPELPSNPCSILNFLKAGASLEDVPKPRSRHHFHISIANPGITPPNPNSGLDNKTDHPKWANEINKWSNRLYHLSFDLTGASTEKRALGIEGAEWETEYQNYFAWPDTRNYFYKALTYESKSTREHYLALTFLSMGHTVHLLEDMGVPAHTRNDFVYGHMKSTGSKVWKDWGNPFEDWVEEQIIANGDQSPWLGSVPIVFDKLSEYFDSNAYIGDYLGDSALPPQTWGLSECTNYQFLSLSTMFGCSGTKYQFPHPARNHVEPNLVLIVPKGHKLYFNGSNYGVPHIARDSYTHYKASLLGYNDAVINRTNTTDDVNVFVDYANITIPRTIDYAAGLLNYFFRGRLTIEPNCLEPDCNLMELYITNDSNNSGVPQVLNGGSFELYWDDRDGNRTIIDDFTIPGWIPGSSTLEYEDQIVGTFTRPDSDGIESYTLVYKGQINANPSQPDNDDPIAIAVATIGLGYPIVAWGDDSDGIVSNIPEGNDFVDVAAGKYHALAIRSDGSLAAWGWNDYGQCDVPPGNDYVAIAGGSRHSIALKSDGSLIGWGDNSSGQIDVPTGNNYVAIASGDYHNLAITTQGLIVGWGGWNYYGECDAPDPNTGTVYVAVSAGRYHSLALQSDGAIRAWGSNEMGQTRIYMFAGDDHEAVAAADNYNFLLLLDDMLITWGGGDWYEPGIPDYHYRQPDENDFVAIAAGTLHILALTADGRILSWGWDDYDPPPYPVPLGIVFTKDIAAGYNFSLALKAR